MSAFPNSGRCASPRDKDEMSGYETDKTCSPIRAKVAGQEEGEYFIWRSVAAPSSNRNAVEREKTLRLFIALLYDLKR